MSQDFYYTRVKIAAMSGTSANFHLAVSNPDGTPLFGGGTIHLNRYNSTNKTLGRMALVKREFYSCYNLKREVTLTLKSLELRHDFVQVYDIFALKDIWTDGKYSTMWERVLTQLTE